MKVLKRLLDRYAGGGRGLTVGPAIGVDSAVIDLSGSTLLAKTDPITFVSEDIGRYAVHINANDIAVMGGVPRWFLAAILLPEGKSTVKSVQAIFAGLARACAEIDVALCGGHTEVTPGIDRPIVVGHMLGTAEGKEIITGAGARPGDALILTKGIAIEAVSVLARTRREELEKFFPGRFIRRCRDFLRSPGLSVVKDAAIAAKNGRVHAMHDPTEGGLSCGLHEMAIASGCGMLIERGSIPVLPEAQALCGHFGIDPLGAIASGALIISADPRDASSVVSALLKAGVNAARIGTVTRKSLGVKISGDGKVKKLKLFERDELTRIP